MFSTCSLLLFKAVHSPYATKCSSAEASLIHMYWSCPSLKHTLPHVFKRWIGTESSGCSVWGHWGEMQLAEKQHASSSPSLLTRRTILDRWRDAAPSTHTQWLTLWDIMPCLLRKSDTHLYSKCNTIFKMEGSRTYGTLLYISGFVNVWLLSGEWACI